LLDSFILISIGSSGGRSSSSSSFLAFLAGTGGGARAGGPRPNGSFFHGLPPPAGAGADISGGACRRLS